MTARQVRGLELNDVITKVELSREWYALEAITVVLHSLVYVPPLIVAGYTMAVQVRVRARACVWEGVPRPPHDSRSRGGP